MVLITVCLPVKMVKMLEKLVEEGKYATRSEAIRAIIASYFNDPTLTVMRYGQHKHSYYCNNCKIWLPKSIFDGILQKKSNDIVYCCFCGSRLKTKPLRSDLRIKYCCKTPWTIEI